MVPSIYCCVSTRVYLRLLQFLFLNAVVLHYAMTIILLVW